MKDAPHYTGHRQRLKERLLRDPASLADYEILELTLAAALPRCDTKPLAKQLLAAFGGLREALLAPDEELLRQKGFGPGLQAHWTLLRELFARQLEGIAREREILDAPDVVAEAAKLRFGGKIREEFWVALVDNKNRVIGWETVSKGTVDETAVYPREVLALALSRGAAGLILAHNHPGGDPTPSPEDVLLTGRIKRGCSELGIRLLDHVVVTAHEYYSFQENGRL